MLNKFENQKILFTNIKKNNLYSSNKYQSKNLGGQELTWNYIKHLFWYQFWPWHLPLSLPWCIPAPSRPWTDPSCTRWRIPWTWGWSGTQCTHTGGRPAWRWLWPSPGTPQPPAQSGRSRGGRQWSGPGDTLVLSQSEKKTSQCHSFILTHLHFISHLFSTNKNIAIYPDVLSNKEAYILDKYHIKLHTFLTRSSQKSLCLFLKYTVCNLYIYIKIHHI